MVREEQLHQAASPAQPLAADLALLTFPVQAGLFCAVPSLQH